MTSERIKTERSFDKLGLPPMELAETSSNVRNSRQANKCLISIVKKLIITLLLVLVGAGTYILLIKLLEKNDNTHSTEIILVTEIRENSNITLEEDDMEIIFRLKNSSDPKRERIKRSTFPTTNQRDADSLQDIRDMIAKYGLLCHRDSKEQVCKELFMRLKMIADKDNTNLNYKNNFIENIARINLKPESVESSDESNESNRQHIPVLPETLKKRETNNISKLQNILEYMSIPDGRENHAYGYGNPINMIHNGHAPTHLTDTCLLARLLKNNYPHLHGIYDVPTSGPHQYEHPTLPHTRYLPPGPPTYIQGRDTETPKSKLHPQDVDIFMSFLTPKPAASSMEQISNTTTREVDCAPGNVPCDSGEDCVSSLKWCDGNVDCSDASDEARCACKHRVDKSRLCDGYFDCPFGEDEMGCFGCNEHMFSCEDFDMSSQSTCFTKEQRCDNTAECPNHRDEVECNMLAPSLHEKPLFAISNTEGYLHRNFKGEWYPVCKNPYMWAHDACRRETGIIIRPPFIQILPIDPLVKVHYLNTGPGGLLQTSDTCFNSSAVYVTCPDLLCGTRVLSTSQMLRENAAVESHIFGRNKRFLPSNHPYPLMFYGNRKKRDINVNVKKRSLDDTFTINETLYQSILEYIRNRRTERVVGGRPSQPAAWPWMVAIYRNGMFHCGGVILTQNWIMSAAHCVHKFWDNYYEIQVGMLRRFSFSPQEQNHKVTHIIVNQHYKQIDMKNDLSLLRVEPVIQFSRWVRPICLPGPDTAGPEWLWGPSPGTICTAVGWGATVEHGPDPDHLREVEVPIWENCKHRDDRAGKEICAGPVEGGRDACQGDSGGPLLCRNPLNSQQWHIAGIVSHGDGCARKDEPGVYTRVSLFVKWIRYHISSKSLPILQPIQDCPGFKCKSGISKCIPHKRKCDKIIDCLGGEDEVGCDFTKAANNFGSNIFLSEMFKSSENNSKSKVNRITKEAESSFPTENSVVLEITKNTFSTETHTELIETPIPSSTITYITNKDALKETTKQTDIDFKYASTIEMPSPTNMDDSDSDEHLTTTISASTSTEITQTTNIDDMQSVAVTFSGDMLESSSFILENEIDQQAANSDSLSNTNIKWDRTTTDDTTLTDFSSTSSMENDNSETFGNNYIDTTTAMNIKVDNTSLDSIKNLVNKREPFKSDENQSSEKTTEELVIELLPNTEIPDFHSTNAEFNDKDEITEEQPPVDNNSKPFSSKQLTDFEDKQDIIHKMEEIVFSELQTATKRRKHRIPKEFECGRITQVIPYHERCNQKSDCEDGTDELGCTCIDYLATFDENLLCDGSFDCADGEDEIDCFNCPEDHFLCKRSQICLPTKQVCDGKSNCPQGEDELDCFALSNGKEIQYDVDDRPQINVEGYVTKRYKDEWHIVCEDKMSLDQMEEATSRICHYLGFSAANRYFIKYINVKEDDISNESSNDKRKKRQADGSIPVNFAYKKAEEGKETARHIIIKEPQIIPEQCVPNITKTCKSLYVFCDRSLFTNFAGSEDNFINRAAMTESNKLWPWIAKVYVDGHYKCTGVLIDLSWVLISHSCLWDTNTHNFISVILGVQRILSATKGPYEQIYRADAKKDLYRNKVILLHLNKPAKYSNMVKPMIVTSSNNNVEKNHICVTVGQDVHNRTISVFLEEISENCTSHNICFKRKDNQNICDPGMFSSREWPGIISCHSEQGWYPVASFIDSRGECGLGNHIIATEIENLKNEIKHYSGKNLFSDAMEQIDHDDCEGRRCSRGRCIGLTELCDGVRHCEDGNDESAEACYKKHKICEEDPFTTGCECSSGQMKCRNGKCISKTLFRDGHDNCGDGTDEPGYTTCSDYLARVMPSRLCDGILHCHDRSDEDPVFCKCYAKKTYKCGRRKSDGDRCVAPDMVCDGIRDCPNGEDELTCIGLSAPDGTPHGTGQVIVRSHGVWHSKCYNTPNHTKSELEAICRELGFISGHAKEIKDMDHAHPHNNLVIDSFSKVVLNNNTVIRMRNTQDPIAKAVFNENMRNCYPVFIECL